MMQVDCMIRLFRTTTLLGEIYAKYRVVCSNVGNANDDEEEKLEDVDVNVNVNVNQNEGDDESGDDVDTFFLNTEYPTTKECRK